MTIEPISSAMTYQAQATQKIQPIEKSITEITDDSVREATVSKDITTASVQKVEAKNDESSSETGEQSTSDQIRKSKEQINKSVEQINKSVEQINKKMSNSEVQFGIHDKTNRITIKIIDKETKEVIKELPPEKTLDMIAKAWELAGILVDEKL